MLQKAAHIAQLRDQWQLYTDTSLTSSDNGGVGQMNTATTTASSK
jgi:hypothetical protein